MAKKRKLDGKPVEAPHQQEEENPTPFVEEQEMDPEEVREGEEEEDEEISKRQGEEGEGGGNNETAKAPSSSEVTDDLDEDPVLKLLEPFSKEQILNLLVEAAEKHSDVADRVRKVADEDPAHRKIFVHGLGWDANTETLTTVFKEYGEIEDCKSVSDKISGKSKGYGFILFKTRKGARKALQQPQKKIGNRMAACQLASMGPVPTAAAVPAVAVSPASEYTQRKIYVSNVSPDLDPQKLMVFFAKFGDIEEGPLGLDKQTGKPKGFCLFVYKAVDSAKKALEEPHKNFEGHVLHCQKAIDGPKPGKSQHHHYQNSSFQRNKNPKYSGQQAAGPGPAHLMAPSGPAMGLNPAAVGQALTALLQTQGGGGLGGITNLLGTMATPGYGTQGGYGNPGATSNTSQGGMGGYGNQVGYANQQMGQGGSARPQQGAGHMGGVPPYMNR